MDNEKGNQNNNAYGRRCPSISELFAYTSVVVVFVAILVPLQINYGFGPVFQSVELGVNENSALYPVISVFKSIKSLVYSRESQSSHTNTGEKIFSKEELWKFGPESDDLVYLGFLGKVYDVTSGKMHYGKGGAYSFFSGVDGTRAYATGKFNVEGLIDNISGLVPTAYLSLQKWEDTFKEKYPCIGKVVGYFYDKNGHEIEEGMRVLKDGIELGKLAEEEDKEDEKKFPGCNSMFTQETGSQVWCTQNSGAVNRDWTGVPRKYFKPGYTNFRCACVKLEMLPDPRFREFKDCPSYSHNCKLVE